MYVLIIERSRRFEVHCQKEHSVTIRRYVQNGIRRVHTQYSKIVHNGFKFHVNPFACVFAHRFIAYDSRRRVYFTAIRRPYRIYPLNRSVAVNRTRHVNIHTYCYFRASRQVGGKTCERLAITICIRGFFRTIRGYLNFRHRYVLIIKRRRRHEVCRYKEHSIAIGRYVHNVIFRTQTQHFIISYNSVKLNGNPLAFVCGHGCVIYDNVFAFYFAARRRPNVIYPTNRSCFIENTRYVNIHRHCYRRTYRQIGGKTYKRMTENFTIRTRDLLFTIGHNFILLRINCRIGNALFYFGCHFVRFIIAVHIPTSKSVLFVRACRRFGFSDRCAVGYDIFLIKGAVCIAEFYDARSLRIQRFAFCQFFSASRRNCVGYVDGVCREIHPCIHFIHQIVVGSKVVDLDGIFRAAKPIVCAASKHVCHVLCAIFLGEHYRLGQNVRQACSRCGNGYVCIIIRLRRSVVCISQQREIQISIGFQNVGDTTVCPIRAVFFINLCFINVNHFLFRKAVIIITRTVYTGYCVVKFVRSNQEM